MSDNANILESSWAVFINGVQVPHQGFQLEFVKNNLSGGTVTVEPDNLLTQIRPESIISIFAKERFVDDDLDIKDPIEEFQKRYYLYWEGTISGLIYSKSPSDRAIQLQCESLFGVWRRARAFALGIGAIQKSSVISGSVQVAPNAATNSDVYSFLQLTQQFDTPVDVTFSNRLIRMVNHITSFNGVLRQQSTRLRLLNRVGGIQDDLYEGLFFGLSTQILAHSMQVLSEAATVYDTVNHLQQYGFYSNFEIPAPCPVKHLSTPIPTLGLDPIYDTTLEFRQNQLMFLPETFFAMPPACNLIFPDMYRSMTVSRQFYNEPTRTILQSPYNVLRGLEFYIAPPSLIRGLDPRTQQQISGAELFSMVISAISSDSENLSSPYQSKVQNEIVETLSSVSFEELEKGILTNIDSYSFESLAAVARSNDNGDQYTSFITQALGYRHALALYNRSLQINMTGVRDILPGLPAIVFDTDISYLAQVDSFTLNVDPLGVESSTAVFSRARPVVATDYVKIDELSTKVIELVRARGASLNRASQLEPEEAARQRAVIRSNTALAISSILSDFQNSTGIPIPPTFFNPDLLDLPTLDKLYEEEFGCTKLYTGPFAEDEVSRLLPGIAEAQLGEDTPVELQGLYAYASGLNTLNNIFTMFPDIQAFNRQGSQTLPTWQEQRETANPLGGTSFEWASRNFHKRRRLTVAQYLEQHGLVLEPNQVQGSASGNFFVLTPGELVSNPDGWDNSLYSKLVIDGDSDPVIDKLRATAPDYLKTGERRKVILEYATKHFGSRAFSGS